MRSHIFGSLATIEVRKRSLDATTELALECQRRAEGDDRFTIRLHGLDAIKDMSPVIATLCADAGDTDNAVTAVAIGRRGLGIGLGDRNQ